MNTIFLVLKREYLVRVRKKSFIIMTILGPLLSFGFYAMMIFLAVSSVDEKKIEVIDASGMFKGKIPSTETYKFSYPEVAFADAKKNFLDSKYDVLAYIPADIMKNPKGIQLYAEKGVSYEIKSEIEKAVEREIENIKLTQAGITRKVLEEAKVSVDSDTISLNEEGEKESSTGAATAVGGICAFVLYITMMIYGTQVMRSITEEKTNRIVEVIISSIKPFQLMLGKILGVAMVGLTQFLLWILLTVGLFTIAPGIMEKRAEVAASVSTQVTPDGTSAKGGKKATVVQADNPVTKVMKAVGTLNLPLIIGCFLFYYLGGYLLYSALFGAIGAAVDNEADTQQFVFPIMLPIIFSFGIAQFVLRDPDGGLAFWASMIPFTSPIVMMVRVPLGVPVWELALSMVLLVLGFIGTIWLASRIYRVGILMYGKKPTFKEMSKWLFYKG
ncbi:ABC transporter permease [Arsenicibacter rosenii]|uniref:ABC transporter permease n=1 Tax=Arsenicibacter rosenii TaxID=1750698 RepID=A0A1S2VE88_9BACT|nr:ABC transporter permease [Arsenicibacter rosenii]OIN56595.1 ABC transporter permease [Arsenicibacter rosenii]